MRSSRYLGIKPKPQDIKEVGLYPSKVTAANRRVAALSRRKKAITMAIRRAQRGSWGDAAKGVAVE